MLNDRLLQFVNIDLHDVKVISFLVVACLHIIRLLNSFDARVLFNMGFYFLKVNHRFIFFYSVQLFKIFFLKYEILFNFFTKGYCISAGSKEAF